MIIYKIIYCSRTTGKFKKILWLGKFRMYGTDWVYIPGFEGIEWPAALPTASKVK